MIALIVINTNDPVAINWGDIATWMTGIATIALFIIGFIQIRNERDSRLKREKEEERRNRRSQAELISSWMVYETQREDGMPMQWIAVLNQSAQPVYQVIVSIVAIGNLGQHRGGPNKESQDFIAVAPPGQGYTAVNALYHGMNRRPAVEIAFQDATGNKWVRKPLGELIEIEVSTLEYYKDKYEFGVPMGWHNLLTEIPPDEELEISPDEGTDLPPNEPK